MNAARLLAVLVFLGFCTFLNPTSAEAQKRVQLKLPEKDKTGGYHGKIHVTDATFINDDQHVVVTVNECVVVFDVKTGRRLNTVLNRRLDENMGRAGHSVNLIHVVNDGATLLTDPSGAWRTPANFTGMNYHRWMLWDTYRLGIPARPDPRPFFSREGLSRLESTAHGNRLDFIEQLGPDFVFLHSFKSDEGQPTTFRVFREGDRIDRPRQQIEFKPDRKTLYLVLRERWRPMTGFGVQPVTLAGEPRQSYRDLTKCEVLQFKRDTEGVVSFESESVDESEAQQQRIAERRWLFQNRSWYHGNLAPLGVVGPLAWQSTILPHLGDIEIDPEIPVGMPSHNGNLVAVTGGRSELHLPLRRRSRKPAVVRVWNRESSQWTHALPCGESSATRAIAFSSDDRMLLTVHEIERPGLAIWHLQDSQR